MGAKLGGIKFLRETDEFYVVGGYGHVWGDQTQRDAYGEFFTPESDLMPDLAPTKLVFYDHALEYAPDGDWFDHPIGKAAEVNAHVDDVGKWIEAQLDKRAEWVDAVMELVERKSVGWSSGSVAHLVKRRPDGWLERWPVVEYSITTSPAEPRNTDVNRIRSAYKRAGLDLIVEPVRSQAEGPDGEGENDGQGLRLVRAKFNLLRLQER